jgi:uncharacterized protein (TIGR03435 family)
MMEFLAEWTIRASILIASGALLLWMLRVKDSSIRAAAWTAMLCGSLAIPALTIASLKAALPGTFLPNFRSAVAGVVVQSAPVPLLDSPSTLAAVPTLAPAGPTSPSSSRSVKPEPFAMPRFDWERAGLVFYAAICGAMLLRLCAGLWVGRRLRGNSRATGHNSSGIEIRESNQIASPLTVGLWHPAILLPADWREWDGSKWEAVLAHERCHILRRDPWVQLLSGMHRAFLWVSPLSWFLHQRIVETAEEASDDAAVAAIYDRVSYAETLLHFMQRGVWNSELAGVPMARHGSPENRIRRILNSSVISRGATPRVIAAIMALVSPLAYVIATAQARPRFDIADVHVSAATSANQTMGGGRMRDGIYQIQNATMMDLIRTAYGVDADKVLGGPSWLEQDRYNVFAKGPVSTSAETARLMLQALLADRFQLVVRRESRSLPGFALTVEKGAVPKLKRAGGSGSSGCNVTFQYTEAELYARRQAFQQAGQDPFIQQSLSYVCRNMTMADFAGGMRNMVAIPQYLGAGAAEDQTGLSGEWDFNLKYTYKPPAYAAAQGIDGETISIFDAMEKQLGLKLVAAKIPTPVMVVESVNRKPTENPPDVKTIPAPAPPSQFEVAYLKLSDPNASGGPGPGPQPGGKFEVRNYPLRSLITMAWEITGDLTGAPAWLNSARVDLTAKLPATPVPYRSGRADYLMNGVPVDIFAFDPALRALLTERFKVAVHMEQRPVPGYALVAAKPKMQKADPSLRTKCKEGPGADGKDPRVSHPVLSRLVTCQNMTMPELAQQLQPPGRLSAGYIISGEVLDDTGLKGAYDFTLSFSRPAAPSAQAAMGGGSGQAEASVPDGGITLFDALEKQLGLKLVKRSILSPVAVLDHIERKPTDN